MLLGTVDYMSPDRPGAIRSTREVTCSRSARCYRDDLRRASVRRRCHVLGVLHQMVYGGGRPVRTRRPDATADIEQNRVGAWSATSPGAVRRWRRLAATCAGRTVTSWRAHLTAVDTRRRSYTTAAAIIAATTAAARRSTSCRSIRFDVHAVAGTIRCGLSISRSHPTRARIGGVGGMVAAFARAVRAGRRSAWSIAIVFMVNWMRTRIFDTPEV